MTPRLDLVSRVENHTFKPIPKVTKIQTKTIHEWTLSQVRLFLKMSPGIETTKVAKMRPASAKAPSHRGLGLSTWHRILSLLLSGACASNRLGVTFSVVATFMAALDIKITATSRPPVAAKRPLATRNGSRYLAPMFPCDEIITWRSTTRIYSRSEGT